MTTEMQYLKWVVQRLLEGAYITRDTNENDDSEYTLHYTENDESLIDDENLTDADMDWLYDQGVLEESPRDFYTYPEGMKPTQRTPGGES